MTHGVAWHTQIMFSWSVGQDVKCIALHLVAVGTIMRAPHGYRLTGLGQPLLCMQLAGLPGRLSAARQGLQQGFV